MTTEITEPQDTWPCCVCDEPAGPDARSDCYRCGEYFHLRLTTTATGPDCGDVWIDDEVVALQFACRNCLDEQTGGNADEEAQEASSQSDEASERPRSQRAAGGVTARDLARRRR